MRAAARLPEQKNRLECTTPVASSRRRLGHDSRAGHSTTANDQAAPAAESTRRAPHLIYTQLTSLSEGTTHPDSGNVQARISEMKQLLDPAPPPTPPPPLPSSRASTRGRKGRVCVLSFSLPTSHLPPLPLPSSTRQSLKMWFRLRFFRNSSSACMRVLYGWPFRAHDWLFGHTPHAA